jgi:hypothetical protein
MKYLKKKYEGPTNKLKKVHNFFWNFLILKRGLFGQILKKKLK